MEFWLYLPEHFKRSVIKKLDYKSRCRFRKCSKLDEILVDSCPVLLEHVNFEPRLGSQVYLSIEEELTYEHCGSVQKILQDFLLIFKNPKSKIKKLSIAHFNFQRQPDAVNDFVTSLLAEMESSNRSLKIEKLAFHWGEIKETVFLELFKKMDSKVFKSIFLRKFPIKNQELMLELVETEQWKNLKEIRLQEKLSIPLERIHPVNVLSVTFHSLNAASVWGYVKRFRSTPSPLQSFFQISTSQNLPIEEILGSLDESVRNDPFSTDDAQIKHTQRFQLSWSPKLILVVKIGSRRVKGTICRKNCPEEDFDALEEILVQEIV
ncbi:unnamed protein product [Caenorhabditis brenneri]